MTGPANAARDHLKTVLHRELWDVCLRLHHQQCACRKKTYFDHQDKFTKVRARPLEHVFQCSSMNDIISRLSKFSYTPTTATCTPPFPGCHRMILSKKLAEELLRILTGCAWIVWIGASRSARMTMKTTGVTTTQLTDAGIWDAGSATLVPLGITAGWDGQIKGSRSWST